MRPRIEPPWTAAIQSLPGTPARSMERDSWSVALEFVTAPCTAPSSIAW